MRAQGVLSFVTLCLPLALATTAAAQASAPAHVGRNVAEMKFEAVPGLPTCGTAAVQTGDPSKGPTIILAKVASGCIVPWHWHTPNEHLMLVSGAAKVEIKDGAPFTLRAGGFAMLPSKHVHQFTCQQTCLMYVASDAAFDTHYVNPQGTEITPTEALAAVKEKTVEAPK
jgi:quercetin dioxygenase-like cupin family protein